MPIVIRGFDKQHCITANDVAERIKQLPSAHIKGLRSILFRTARELQTLNIPVNTQCKGAYYPEYRSIMIHDIKNRDEGIHIVLHEIGHYVFHTFIDSYKRKEWTCSVYPKSRFITQYASTSSEEDFAECYAEFAKDRESLKKIPAKYAFMLKYVFK